MSKHYHSWDLDDRRKVVFCTSCEEEFPVKDFKVVPLMIYNKYYLRVTNKVGHSFDIRVAKKNMRTLEMFFGE